MGHDEDTNNFNGGTTPVTPNPRAQLGNNRLGMQKSRDFSAADELNRIVEAEQKENIAASGGDIVLAPAEKAPKDKKVFIIIALAVITVVVFAVGIFMKGGLKLFTGDNNKDSEAKKVALEKGIGTPNLDAIFNTDGLIPYKKGDLYGYVDQGGTETLEAKYISAGDFYGGFAAVTFLENNGLKSAVIDKSGNVKVSGENNAEYDIENNIWIVDDNIYTFDFNKLNDDNTNAYYLGGGYIKNTPIEMNGEYSKVEGNPYITNTNKEKVYSCKTQCFISADEYGKYSVVSEEGENSKIIKLSDGSVVYTSERKDSLTFSVGSTFEEKNENGTQYITIGDDDKATVSSEYPSSDDKNYISGQKDYYFDDCGNGTYNIKKGDDEIVGCELYAVTNLSKNTFLKLKKENKPAVILTYDDKNVLYNLEGRGEIYNFNSNEYIVAPDNSPFVGGLGDNKFTIYNILNNSVYAFSDSSTISNVEYHNNYVKLVIGGKEKIFNNSLSEVR